MKNIKIYNLYSGSGGNSTFVRVGETAILIDAGRNARMLCRALGEIGEDIKNISAIFITHDHGDHTSALEVLSKKNDIPIYITRRSAEKFSADSCVRARLVERDILFCESIGDIKISSFQTPHDSLMSVGYRIEYEDTDGIHAIGYATDIGYVSDSVRNGLLGCEAVIVEANHDLDMLMSGPYPRELKTRVSSRRGHLSNDDCAALSLELAQNGTRAIMLAHLSKENNEPYLAFDTVSSALSGFDVDIFIAHPTSAVELVIPQKSEERICLR